MQGGSDLDAELGCVEEIALQQDDVHAAQLLLAELRALSRRKRHGDEAHALNIARVQVVREFF